MAKASSEPVTPASGGAAPLAASDALAQAAPHFGDGAFGDLASFHPAGFRYTFLAESLKAATEEIADRCVAVPLSQLQALDPQRDAAVRDFGTALIKKVPERFFRGGKMDWTCPLTLERLELRGGVPTPTGLWLASPDGSAPCTVMIESQALLGCYYHEHNVFFHAPAARHQVRVQVRNLIRFLSSDKKAPSYVERAAQGALTPALVIGDVRPAHFLSQSLNFLSKLPAEEYDRLKARRGIVVIVKDWCFVDPRQVVPQLSHLPSLEVSSADLSNFVRDLGLRCHRFVRYGSRLNFTAVRGYASRQARSAALATDAVSAWISLDAERLRVHNQVALFSALLRHLDKKARSGGKSLRVYWDGWTAGRGEPNAKDLAVNAAIRDIAAAIREESGVVFEEVELFTLPMMDKVALASGANIAFATYGTACLAPNIIGGVPTVAYHVGKVVHEGGYTDPELSALLTDDAVTQVARHDLAPHLREFSVDIDAAIAACDAVLRGG